MTRKDAVEGFRNYSFVLFAPADGEGRSFALRVNGSETYSTHPEINGATTSKDLAYG